MRAVRSAVDVLRGETMTFIDVILEIMDKIVDVLSDMARILTNIAIGVITVFIMAFMLLTAPVWIVPYLVWKRRSDPE